MIVVISQRQLPMIECACVYVVEESMCVRGKEIRPIYVSFICMFTVCTSDLIHQSHSDTDKQSETNLEGFLFILQAQ